MAIEFLEITNFRNLQKVCLEPSPKINIIVGDNGSGKTSLLESIYFLGTARSFRTSLTRNLISVGEKQFTVFARIQQNKRGLPIGIARDRSQQKIKINGQNATSASQLAEILPVQIINPDTHKLLEDGPRVRRRFIEWGVFHVEPEYFPLWQKCRTVLKQRNAALKTKVSSRELKHWEQTLCEISGEVDWLRKKYINMLQPVIDRLLDQLKGLPTISIELDSGWGKNKSLMQVLEETRAGDFEKGFTQYGPHRSDLKIMTNGVKAKEFVSRGQQKLITALFKIAQVNLLKQVKPSNLVVLLLDDLPAELDSGYRDALMNVVSELEVQTFLTSTELNLVETFSKRVSSRSVFHVKHGNVGTTIN